VPKTIESVCQKWASVPWFEENDLDKDVDFNVRDVFK